MVVPKHTRLRYRSAEKPETLQAFCDTLGKRIEIKAIVYDPDSKLWFLWFIPDDRGADVASGKMRDRKTR